MLPEAHQRDSDQSELFNSLKVYLNNRNRLQPFIGLSSIIECVNGSAHQRDAFYICEVCVCRLDMADMRNHIMGSLHRYNYTKTKHPELVSDLEKGSCLSKLAWPLMDIAKKIEENEGPGNVQVVEFDKTSYQQLESQSDNAKNVIDFLKDTLKQSEPEISEMITSEMWELSPSKRIVLFSPQKNSEKASLNLQNSPQHRNVSDGSSESFVDSSSFLSDYTGRVPLTGLVRVIECKSEGGHTYCFLCHCCRIRSLKNDIIDHLTHASHVTNYLMETRPEQLDRVNLNDISHLELLAEKLNKEEGGTDITKLKVVQIPESLCIQMTGKSYHWCVKTLGLHNSDFPVKYIDVKRQKLPTFSNHKDCSLEAEDDQVPKGKKMIQKTSKENNPVFKVTLPVTQGLLLVERTSFSKDGHPSFPYSPTEIFSPSPTPIPSLSPDAQNVFCDFSSGFFDTTSDDTNLSSKYQLNSSTDFPECSHEYIKQEKDEQWINSFENQNFDSNTNIVTKPELGVSQLGAPKAYNVQAPPVFHSENVSPHGFLWALGTKENERSAVNHNSSSTFPQQHMFTSEYTPSVCGMIPQVPQAGYSFSHNNSITIADCSGYFPSFYTDHGANTQEYASYEVSSSVWGAHQPPPAYGQPPCYSPCCVPPNPSAAFSNVEPGSSNAAFYPMSNLYSNHWYPY